MSSAAINATSRAVLEWLADRSDRAFTVASVAEWLEVSVPKCQGALAKLRDLGLVNHFEGDPGTWSVSRRGLSEIKFDAGGSVTSRYRMALDAICLADAAWPDARYMQKLARSALAGGKDR